MIYDYAFKMVILSLFNLLLIKKPGRGYLFALIAFEILYSEILITLQKEYSIAFFLLISML